MLIPGVSDADLERVHWNYGGGKGELELRHVPTGITVARECLLGVSTLKLMELLQVELQGFLSSAGIIEGGHVA